MVSLLMLSFLISVVSGDIKSCLLKQNAECKTFCDDSLLDAGYVEGILLSGHIADFSCLKDMSNIKWVKLLDENTTCLNRSDFKGTLLNNDFCIIHAKVVKEEPAELQVNEAAMTSTPISSPSRNATVIPFEKATNFPEEKAETTTKTSLWLGERNKTKMDPIIQPSSTDKDPHDGFIGKVLVEASFVTIMGVVMYALGLLTGVLLICFPKTQMCFNRLMRRYCRSQWSARKGEMDARWMLNQLHTLISADQDVSAYSRSEKKRIFGQFQTLVNAILRDVTLVEMTGLLENDEEDQPSVTTLPTHEGRGAEARAQLSSESETSVKPKNKAKSRLKQKRIALTDGAVQYLLKGIHPDGRTEDIGRPFSSGVMDVYRSSEEVSKSKKEEGKRVEVIHGITTSDSLLFRNHRSAYASQALDAMMWITNPSNQRGASNPEICMKSTETLVWDDYDLFPL